LKSKLWQTLVGVGVALGGAPLACLGKSAAPAGESDSGGGAGVAGGGVVPRGGSAGEAAPGGGGGVTPVGAGGAPPAGAGGVQSGGVAGALADGGVPVDPFCEVTWPPTKANPEPQALPCVDPFNQCTTADVPYCLRVLEGGACEFGDGRAEGLICVAGAWECPPGWMASGFCTCFATNGGESNCERPDGGGAGGEGGAGP
jgi:hypothetical protein